MSVCWTHACCGDCWFLVFTERALEGPPIRVKDAPPTACCFCDGRARSGIFIRRNPADPILTCKGECRT